MGSKNSVLNQEQLEEYVELTYLTKAEVLYVLKKFVNIYDRLQIEHNLNNRINVRYLMEEFPALKFNPFRDRLIRVFSSLQDNHFSFEDFLDLCSVMSINCSFEVKASWAFRVFDIDEDGQITKFDLNMIIDRLTRDFKLSVYEKDHISDILLNEMDLQNSGGMTEREFVHSITKIPEFVTTFSFRL